MKPRRKYLSEERWARMPDTIIRCKGHWPDGRQCRAQANDGAVVCDTHGGAAPQVKARAAQRLLMTADQAASKMIAWMDDPAVPFPTRVKIATDLLDRAGLNASQSVDLRAEVDPVKVVMDLIAKDPDRWLEPLRHVDVVDAQIVEDDPPDVLALTSTPYDPPSTTDPNVIYLSDLPPRRYEP